MRYATESFMIRKKFCPIGTLFIFLEISGLTTILLSSTRAAGFLFGSLFHRLLCLFYAKACKNSIVYIGISIRTSPTAAVFRKARNRQEKQREPSSTTLLFIGNATHLLLHFLLILSLHSYLWNERIPHHFGTNANDMGVLWICKSFLFLWGNILKCVPIKICDTYDMDFVICRWEAGGF